MPTTTSTVIYVRKLGHLWMGGRAAKHEERLAVGTGPFEVDLDPTDDEAILAHVDTHEGDLADFVADVRVVRTTQAVESYTRGRDGARVTETRSVSHERIVRAFTEDEELSYSDCFAEPEEVDA